MENLEASPDQVYRLQKVFVLVTAVPYFVLIWDWLSNLSKEYSLIRRSNGSNIRSGSGVLSIKNAFIASRYINLLWCTFVVVVLGNVGNYPSICSWTRYFPYGYSTTMLFAHFVVVLRMYSIYERRRTVLILLLSLAALDYALQMSANHAATSILLSSQNPDLSICFIVPTSLLYSLVFISPTIFHHIMLIMTLYKSIHHLRETRAGGIASIMDVVQRDQILFVLAICLINFSNLVLVLQGSSWPYRLINQLPAAVFTQIFLSKIIFNLKHVQKKLASANVSPDITTLALSPSSRRNEFDFGTSNCYDDLESDVGFKPLSPPAPVNSPGGKWNRNEFLGSTTAANKNVFTLRFDPNSNKREQHQTSPLFSPPEDDARRAPTQRDGFRVEQAYMESQALSSYRLPSPIKLDADSIKSAYASPYANLEQHPPPASAAGADFAPVEHTDVQHHLRSTRNENINVSHYIGVPVSGREGDQIQALQAGTNTTPLASEQAVGLRSQAEPVPQVKTEGKDTTETITPVSPDNTKRRASTIDDQQRDMDWEPPTAWGSSPSPRISPIPFSERRLSNSLARTSLSIRRSRHASFASGGDAGRTSLDALPSSASQYQLNGGVGGRSASPIRILIGDTQHRGSACYASVFSFGEDEEQEGQESQDEEGLQPLGKGA